MGELWMWALGAGAPVAGFVVWALIRDRVEKRMYDLKKEIVEMLNRESTILQGDINEIKTAVMKLSDLVPEIVAVKTRVEDLTKSVDRLVAKNGKS